MADSETTPKAEIQEARKRYRVGRGEEGVFTFEPYKSHLLPLWRFKTPDIARRSSQDLWQKFIEYDGKDDFVGMDMTRKFIQMGMTRAKRYANRPGGRKYAKHSRVLLPKSADHHDAQAKLEASEIFREVWNACQNHEGYMLRKKQFLEEQRLDKKAS